MRIHRFALAGALACVALPAFAQQPMATPTPAKHGLFHLFRSKSGAPAGAAPVVGATTATPVRHGILGIFHKGAPTTGTYTTVGGAKAGGMRTGSYTGGAPRTGSFGRPVSSMSPMASSGQVWVNTKTKVYHLPGSQFYGKTKNGRYMSAAAAKQAGYHAAGHGE